MLKYSTKSANATQKTFITVSGVAGQPRGLPQRRPKPAARGGTQRPRNTKRGLRKQEAIEKRQQARSIKRNLARKNYRNNRGKLFRPMAVATAQEPQCEREKAIKRKWNKDLYLASLNIQGMMRVAKIEEVESWMRQYDVDILALQETHVPTTHREVRRHFTWYFSGTEQGGDKAIRGGVAIVMRNELRNYVTQVEPISDRIMSITLRGSMPVKVFSVYAHTAQTAEKHKNVFYKKNNARN